MVRRVAGDEVEGGFGFVGNRDEEGDRGESLTGW